MNTVICPITGDELDANTLLPISKMVDFSKINLDGTAKSDGLSVTKRGLPLSNISQEILDDKDLPNRYTRIAEALDSLGEDLSSWYKDAPCEFSESGIGIALSGDDKAAFQPHTGEVNAMPYLEADHLVDRLARTTTLPIWVVSSIEKKDIEESEAVEESEDYPSGICIPSNLVKTISPLDKTLYVEATHLVNGLVRTTIRPIWEVSSKGLLRISLAKTRIEGES